MKFVLFVLLSALGAAECLADTQYRGLSIYYQEVTAEQILDIGANKSANVARYLMMYDAGNVDSSTAESYDAWLDTAIAQLDALLPTFEAAGIKVVIDLHYPPGGYATRSSPSWHRIFTEQWAATALIAAWNKLATHYVGNSNIAAYEILNEPAERAAAPGLKNWNGLAGDIISEIRTIDPTQTIIVSPKYGNQEFLKSFKPITGSNIAYTFHMYYPSSFTKQGLDGQKLGATYPSKKLNKATIESKMTGAVKFAKKNKVKMWVTEFTVVRWAPGTSAVKYLKDVIKYFEKNKFAGWMYFGIGPESPFSIDLTSNRNSLELSPTTTDRANLIYQYFHKNKK